jgi:hypothetical protein
MQVVLLAHPVNEVRLGSVVEAAAAVEVGVVGTELQVEVVGIELLVEVAGIELLVEVAEVAEAAEQFAHELVVEIA